MKMAVKTLGREAFTRSPRMVKNNLAFYYVQRWRGLRGVQIRPELTDRADLLHALSTDGVAIVPGFFSADETKRMLTAVDETLERGRAGELRENDEMFRSTSPMKYVSPDNGNRNEFLWRIARVDQLAPGTSPFFTDPTIRSVFRAYVSPNISAYRCEADYRFGLLEFGQADLYHFDNVRPVCKAFLYLNDIGEANAPFAYLKGSHKGRWRRPYELASDVEEIHGVHGRHGVSGRGGHFFPIEVKQLQEQHGWEELVCTGPAGTLILADLRGLHRGTPLREGSRVMLNHTFDLMNA